MSISGNGQVILNGSDAAPANSYSNSGQTFIGSRGSGGSSGSYLAIIDGNHPTPIFTETNVIARYGDGSTTGQPIAINGKYRADGFYRSAHQAIGSSFNYFQSHVRFAYTPDAENVQSRPDNVLDQFFANQRDGRVKIFVQDADPSNANPGDMRITQTNLDNNAPDAPFRILSASGWRDFVRGTDDFEYVYDALIAGKRKYDSL